MVHHVMPHHGHPSCRHIAPGAPPDCVTAELPECEIGLRVAQFPVGEIINGTVPIYVF